MQAGWTAETFRTDSERILAEVRAAVAEMVSLLPGPPAKAADVSRELELDAKLGWQLFRIARASAPHDAGAHIPGAASVERVVRAAASHGLPRDSGERVRRALRSFYEFVERHADSRRDFDTLLAACMAGGGEGSAAEPPEDVACRRDLCRASASLYGLSAAVQFGCVVFHAGEAPGTMDQVMLRGFVDLQWFRPHQSFILARWRRDVAEGHDPREVTRMPLDAEAAARFGGPLLPAFTTDPSPTLRTREVEPGHFITELVGRSVGRSSAATYVLAERMRGLPLATSGTLVQDMVALVRAPVRSIVLDVLVDEDLFGPLMAETSVLGDPSGEAFLTVDPWRGREHAVRLPVSAKAVAMGKAPRAMEDAEVPRYAEMVRTCCEAVGWDWGKMNALRLRVAFPPLHTCVIMALRRAGAAGGAQGSV